MELELEIFDFLCAARKFKINKVKANVNDFGNTLDHSPGHAESYGCGNMRFVPNKPTKKVLEKYDITKEEYQEVCDKLEKGLSFGKCGWCI